MNGFGGESGIVRLIGFGRSRCLLCWKKGHAGKEVMLEIGREPAGAEARAEMMREAAGQLVEEAKGHGV